jgi:biopolymer transport protein TolR
MIMRRRSRKRFMADINVVPYIDVMLVLLVIFMVTAPLLQQGVEIDLPKVADTQSLPTEEQKPIILSVDRNGVYFLNVAENPRQPLDAERVLARAAEVLRASPRLPVLVKADQRVDYGAVVRAMVLLQRAGAAKVGLLTELPES